MRCTFWDPESTPRHAPQADPRRARAPLAQQVVPVGDMRGAMTLRYSSGSGRRGERHEQLSLRARVIDIVRDSLRRFGRPWQELPRGLASWDILPHAAVGVRVGG